MSSSGAGHAILDGQRVVVAARRGESLRRNVGERSVSLSIHLEVRSLVGDLEQWGRWLMANKYRPRKRARDGWTTPVEDPTRVGLTTIGDARISTTFLGVDHSWGFGPPLWFETMVFGGACDLWCDRYETWEEAERGHARVAEAVSEGREP